MTVLHIVTDKYPPTSGGLEKRTKQLAHRFAQAGFVVYVYVLSEYHDYKYYNEEHSHINFRLPYYENKIIGESLRKSKHSDYILNSEDFRLKYLCLKNEIQKVVHSRKCKHIIISNFLTRAGYVSYNVAEEIGIHHIPSIVGTDFSRGFRNPIERTAIERVLEHASAVVTLNNEFATRVRQFIKKDNVFVIHNSISDQYFGEVVSYQNERSLVISSDCGFSHKKGSGVLLNAFRKLKEEGFHIKLKICGGIADEQLEYWTSLIGEYKENFEGDFSYIGYVDNKEAAKFIDSSDVYCSATLGEGCSNSRLLALCLGKVVVTTQCGEILDVASDVSHIRYSMPGDVEGFYQLLRQTLIDILEDKIVIDVKSIRYWREYFNPLRETSQWLSVLDFVNEDVRELNSKILLS